MNKFYKSLAIATLALSLGACGKKSIAPGKPTNQPVLSQKSEETTVGEKQKNKIDAVIDRIKEYTDPALKEINASSYFRQAKTAAATFYAKAKEQFVTGDVDYTEYPDTYKSLGEANLNPDNFPQQGEIVYSDLDELGRSQVAYGTITYDMVEKSKGTRESWEKDSEPSGWYIYKKGNAYVTEKEYNENHKGIERISNNKEVEINLPNKKKYHGHFYNRSHLIADSLGGRAYRNNVITGTRQQNVGSNDKKGGMQYLEWKVFKYFEKKRPEKVFYYAEPYYEGDELVPRYVLLSAMSEDKEINETVMVFNTATGYKIDYHTGEYFKK